MWQKEALQNLVVLSTFLQNRVVLFPISEPRGSPLLLQNHMDLYLSTCFRTSWFSHLLQSRVGYSLFTSEPHGLLLPSEPHGLLLSPPKPCGPPLLWLLGLDLNSRTHLPLQPHFRLLLQSVTPVSIPVFFQLF